MPRVELIALDLEGTLVSNAVSQMPRPGLYEFLEFCRLAVLKLVIYSSVPESKVRDVITNLIAEGCAPAWFHDVDCVRWSHKGSKDLTLIPGANVEATLLIDDNEGYVAPGQRQQWLPIACYEPPYVDDDEELVRVRHVLMKEWGCCAGS